MEILEESQKLNKLVLFNRILAGLHMAQAVVIVILSTTQTFPVTQAYQQFNEKTQSLEAASRHLFDIRLSLAIALFFFLSSLAHIYMGFIRPAKYKENLKEGINYVRWFEYSISASIMIVAIAMLAGMEDLSSLIMMFALTAIMNLTGLIMEVHNKTTKKTNWISFYTGSFSGIVPWIVVAIYFWAAESSATGQIPTFVYGIFVSLFIFFNCFAINMILQYKKIGKWENYLYGERVYMILSLVAKSLLAWQIFAGTLRP